MVVAVAYLCFFHTDWYVPVSESEEKGASISIRSAYSIHSFGANQKLANTESPVRENRSGGCVGRFLASYSTTL